ncbi:hypothetical protein SAMN05444392_10381 [Seinonella peptonophila]|uniref:DUF4870 domain-containing protein n=1 Tax=Seinonella peptonophila TaxID=112248 RepID=A0A1M4W7Y9_9BACL|nr:hypothetical protein [Seinonella peptonophila]SHE77265.1 hypothetical protein SAMN05444392_10381 [Seinonella peptonophila]
MESFFEIDQTDNTSGQGSGAYVPPEAKKWNWGAFLLTWIWGIGNRVWISLFWFVPIIGWFGMPFVLGYKGSSWAWQHKRWKHIYHFQKAQNTWAAVGLLAWLLAIVLGIVLLVVTILWLTPLVINFLSNLAQTFTGLGPLLQYILYFLGFNTNIINTPQPQMQFDPYSF